MLCGTESQNEREDNSEKTARPRTDSTWVQRFGFSKRVVKKVPEHSPENKKFGQEMKELRSLQSAKVQKSQIIN
ncbi:hypothetical protein WISP_60518 [Willisornis vidua]|uniref:Uncharacterized protein n=1 Tax=Willisornis vidua TaxID=1566151 RepID=A0ABQ9DAN3_9PASS|nr:hypothetical protein WISP_60518 [Willisornis vidua]